MADDLLQALPPPGVYDMKAAKELAETVTSMKFSNGHGSLALAVRNGDGSASALAPRGVGSRPGLLKTAIKPDARGVRISAGNAND